MNFRQKWPKISYLYAEPIKRTMPKSYTNTLTKHKKNASLTIFFLITLSFFNILVFIKLHLLIPCIIKELPETTAMSFYIKRMNGIGKNSKISPGGKYKLTKVVFI